MNTELTILDSPGHLQPVPGASPPVSERRPRSKIARLPKKLRYSLNQMIQDGVPYSTIKQNLGEHGNDLTVDNISEWKIHGGYQAWCSEQIWREEIGARLETFAGPLADADPAHLSHVGLQIALVQLCEQLRQLGPGSRTEQFENNATQYLRMLNTLARLAKSSLALQQNRDSASGREAVPKLKQSSPPAAPAATDDQSWLDRADDLFGLKSSQRLVREAAQAIPNCSSRGNEAVVDEQSTLVTVPLSCGDQGITPHPAGLAASNPGSQSAETPGNPPAAIAHPEGMPESSPPAEIKNQKSKIRNCSSRGNEAVVDEQSTLVTVPLSREDQGRTPQPGELPDAEIKNQKLKIETPEPCHFCHAALPPLLPDGRRPHPLCQHCGTALHSPFNRHLYCQSCGTDLRIILVDGRRILSTCPCCDAPLPLWPEHVTTI